MVEVARIYRLDSGRSSLKAFADIVVDGKMLIKGIRVVEGKNGLFAGMPKMQSSKDGKWYDTFRILDDELKQELQSVVLEAYQV